MASDFASEGEAENEREQISLRVASHMIEKMGNQSVGFFACSCFGVYALAFCEGLLLCKKPMESFAFGARYGYENIFPSMTHSTRSAVDVCLAMGYDPKRMLHIDDCQSRGAAVQRLRAHVCNTTRCILMGMVGVAAAVRIIDLESEAVDEYKQRVLNGREPVLKGIKERVIRFIGEESDVSDLSMKLHGQPIIPVVEHPSIEQGMSVDYESIITSLTHDGHIPAAWRVKDGLCESLAYALQHR